VNNPAMADVNALIAHQDAEGAVDLRHEVCDDSFLPDGDPVQPTVIPFNPRGVTLAATTGSDGLLQFGR
jgi:hypothetical protein